MAAKWLSPGLRALHTAYHKRPVLSDCFVGFGTFSLGEWVAQWYKGKQEHSAAPINYDMVFKTGVLGIAINGLLLRKWYILLDRVFSPRMDSYAVIAKKVVADQLFVPPLYLATFFTYTTAVAKDKTWEQKKKEIDMKFQNSFFPAYVADCVVWPLVNITTFRYVPLSYRPAYIGVAELLWQTFLSYIQATPKHNADSTDRSPAKKIAAIA